MTSTPIILLFMEQAMGDTNKEDKVFENTYFVSNLKSKNLPSLQNFRCFLQRPLLYSFHLFDLIDLVNDSKFYDIYPEDKIFFVNIQTVSLNLVM